MSTAIIYLGISVFPAFLAAIVFVDSRRVDDKTLPIRLFRATVLFVCLTITVDVVVRLMEYTSFPGSDLLVWGGSMLLCLCIGASSLFWLLNVLERFHRGTIDTMIRRPILALPTIAATLFYVALVISTPANHLLFYIDDVNVYQRGDLFFVPYILCALALCISTVVAAVGAVHTDGGARRTGIGYLAALSFVVLLSGIMQMIAIDVWIAWPVSSVALFLFYIFTQTSRATEDLLTGLSNRSSFIRALEARWNKANEKDRWALLFIDIDRFKTINDRFGHAAGDEVLRLTADALREAFKGEHVEIARIGGDEFAAFFTCENADDLSWRICHIRDVANRISDEVSPYRFRLSVGGALYDPETQSCKEDLVDAADNRMYEQKRRRLDDEEAGDAR